MIENLPPSETSWRESYPFASHYLSLEGAKYHLLDEFSGDTPKGTLLFVHGNPTWSFHWRNLVLAMRDQYRCIAVDHLGCGLSDAPQKTFRLADRIEHLTQLVDRLDLQNVTLVAQDWGGAIGLGALLKRRERFDRIVLFNTGAFRPWFIPWRIRVCRTPLLGRIGLQGANLFSRAALRMTLSRKSITKEVAAAYLAPHASWKTRRSVYDFVEDIPLNANHPTWATLGEIEDQLPTLADMPSLLVWGMQDWCFTPECFERFQQHWPKAEAFAIEDAGHWVVEDAPQEVLERLTHFLAKSLGAS